MESELESLKKELWKVYQVIKEINAVAGTRNLTATERDKLSFLVRQFKSIKLEIAEEEEKTE